LAGPSPSLLERVRLRSAGGLGGVGVLSSPLPLPAVDRAPTRLRAGVRRTGLRDSVSSSDAPAPLDATREGSGARSGVDSGAESVTGAEFVSGAESAVSAAVRRVGVRRRVVVREPAVREVDREVDVLRRVVLRPFPLSAVAGSSVASGSGVTVRPELEEPRVVRVRRVGVLLVVDALRRRSDHSPVK
jgi:hypothetical protein